MNKEQFINYCKIYRERSSSMNTLYDIGISMDIFMEPCYKIENMFLYNIFGDKSDLIFDWIHEQWDGKVYIGTSLEKTITTDAELYDYITDNP